MVKAIFRAKEFGHTIKELNVGGGLGIKYTEEDDPPSIDEWVKTVSLSVIEACEEYNLDLPVLMCEPGRSIVGDAGVLLSQIILLKNNGQKHFAVVDAGMNDLLRPALYGSWHEVLTVEKRVDQKPSDWEIVGPICETSDFLAKGRSLSIVEGDLIAILDCGAYGFSMSSNYNSRPKAAEILIADKSHFCIRDREKVSDLFCLENLRST